MGIGPESTPACFSQMLQTVQVLVLRRMSVVHPSHSKGNHVRRRILTLALHIRYQAAVSVFVAGADDCLLAVAQPRKSLFSTLAIWLVALRRINGCDAYLDLLVMAGLTAPCSQRVAVTDANDKAKQGCCGNHGERLLVGGCVWYLG
jgi:hypothetical protein